MRLALDRSLQKLTPPFQRERSPLRIVCLAVALYQQGLSFRQVARALQRLGHPVHHVTVWRWLQRCGRHLEGQVWRGSLPPVIVVDETALRTGWGKRWLYAAIDPKTRKLLFLRGYAHRDSSRTLDFLHGLAEAYAGQLPQRVIVDGGPWYVWPLRHLKIERRVVCGGVRNYIERFFRYLKQRMNGLDRYFPRGKSFESLSNWLRMFAWYYNHVRKGLPMASIS